MPITIPVVSGPSVEAKFVPKEGQDVKALPSAFGVSSADDMGTGFMSMSKSMAEHEENQANILATDATNKLNQFQLDTLYNKDNGFFTKQGKSALGQEQSLSDAWDQQVNSIADSIPNKMAQAKFKMIGDKSKIGYMEGIYSHANAQAITYQKDVMANGIEVNSQLAFANRNNPLVVDKYIGNIRGIIAANNPDKSPEAIKLAEDDAISKMHINNISGMLADHNLQAQSYYEKYQNQIAPDAQAALMHNIKENDADIKARLTADSLFNSGVGEQDAFKQAHAIKDLDLRDATESKLSYLYGRQRELKNQAYDNQLDNFWNGYADNPDINNIPTWMKGKDRITAQNYAETFANKATKGKHDPDAYVHLYDMSITNADAFAKTNLNEYRDVLTNDEYKSFAKRQQDIQTHGYTSITPDDKAVKNVLKNVLKTYGSWNVPSKQAVSSQMQSLINEEERRRGSQYSPQDLKAAEQRIAGWLGYSKQGNTVKELSQNSQKADFYKGLENDIMAFEKAHKHPPDQKEFQSILYQRANYSVQGHNQNIYDSIKNTTAKPHETKEVTYYADNYLPQLGKKLGTKFVSVAGGRYNPKDKGYGSYHNQGGVTTAIDVSMSEHSQAQKEAFYRNELKNPQVKAIGTSDKNIIKKFGNNPKLVNETSFDGVHGTNHVNHAHVTLNVPENDLIAAQNSLHSDGYARMKAPNGHIYNVPIGQVAEYQKIGGVKI